MTGRANPAEVNAAAVAMQKQLRGFNARQKTKDLLQGNEAAAGSDGFIKVCVRVRPFNEREIEMGCECIVEMPAEPKQHARHLVI